MDRPSLPRLGWPLLAAASLVAVAAFVFWLQRDEPPAAPAGVPPRWALTSPAPPEPGLAADVQALFSQGQSKMREGDPRGALLDFYNLLKVDPSYPYVDKFATAAAEWLVLDTMQEELARRAVERALRQRERDQLLVEVMEGDREQQLLALNKLRRNFRDDPAVREKLQLAPSTSRGEAAFETGMAALADKRHDEASEAFQRALDETREPALRQQALSRLQEAQRELALGCKEPWSEAVQAAARGGEAGGEAVAEARGEAEAEARAKAAQLLDSLVREHPAHPSARLHLERLKN